MEPAVETAQQTQVISFDNPEHIIGRRVECQNIYGTVKYVGPLKHSTDRQDADQVWLGVQWDDLAHGKHNGTVEGHQYFTCDEGLNSGTLLKAEKANFGKNIFDGLRHRYYNTAKKPNPSALNTKGVSVEYDEEAFFETIKKLKKKVEFLGFDKIWEKLHDLQNLRDLSLPNCQIADIGSEGSLGTLLPNLRNLSLEGNLLYDWNQIYLIGRELKHLEELAISSNNLREPDEVKSLEQIKINSNNTIINEAPLNVFGKLNTIILISMGLTWKTLNKVLPLFLNVKSLVVCHNKLNDFENLTYSGADFKNLELLNLEGNSIKNFEGISKFKDAPHLAKLILNKNELNDLGTITGFESLKTIILEDNNIVGFKIFSQLNMFPNLENLRITKNPISKENQLHVRQRAIAEIKNLKIINGGELKKYERKDCEIYYLKQSFKEFFDKSGQPSYEYDYEDFKAYCLEEHPRIPELIKKYGNPYDDGIKGQAKPEMPKPKMASLISVKLNAFSGPYLGKPTVTKKFTDNTLMVNLKAMLAKQFGIPATQQKIYCKHDPHEPFVPMDEDLKDLKFYGISHGHEIWVGDTEL